MFITEPEKKLRVIADADLCVVGGSSTGVFAAVRAARLGLKVVLIEKHNVLGGTAVAGLVNIWHSMHDIDEGEQVIAGLTDEVVTRLKTRGAVDLYDDPTHRYTFNSFELAVILDDLIKENKIKVMLHTLYTAAICEERRVEAVIIENAEGRFAIKARFFIDASGDGRVAKDLKIPSYVNKTIQPPTSCFYLQGNTDGLDMGKLIREHGAEFGLLDDWGWYKKVVGSKDITMRADNHVFGKRLDIADDLTYAEIEGRRQARALTSLLSKYAQGSDAYSIVGLCQRIGTRETVHYKTRMMADTMSLILGKKYDYPILKGSYRVDIHHSEDMGITFMYLDGKEVTYYGKNTKTVSGNWRERMGIDGDYARYYQLPYDVLAVEEYDNFIPVGRMINADEGAFGALRVMVNLNQLGEAAGVAAYVSLGDNAAASEISTKKLHKLLKDGGSAL